MTFKEIIQYCADHRLTEDQMATFCSETGLSRDDFFVAFSKHIAHAYEQGNLSFEVCDAAINELVFVFANFAVPKYAADVFYAFDMGEFQHDGDSPDTKPEEKYTKPMIAEIIRNETTA